MDEYLTGLEVTSGLAAKFLPIQELGRERADHGLVPRRHDAAVERRARRGLNMLGGSIVLYLDNDNDKLKSYANIH